MSILRLQTASTEVIPTIYTRFERPHLTYIYLLSGVEAEQQHAWLLGRLLPFVSRMTISQVPAVTDDTSR